VSDANPETDAVGRGNSSRKVALLMHFSLSVFDLATAVPWQNLSNDDRRSAAKAEALLRAAAALAGAARTGPVIADVV